MPVCRASHSCNFCKWILNLKYTQAEIDSKYAQLERFARRKFPSSGCFELTWLEQILKKIDVLWYQQKLLVAIQKHLGGLTLALDESETRVAAYVIEQSEGMALKVNRDLFAGLFSQPRHENSGYHSGGLLCKNKLSCLLHVVLHETGHMALTVCEHLRGRLFPDHGKEFNRLALHLFGQTDPQHGLMHGYEQFDDLATLQKKVRAHMKMEAFMDGKWVPCVVLRKRQKTATIKIGGSAREINIHLGLLRFR